jgi:hypothetical protein
MLLSSLKKIKLVNGLFESNTDDDILITDMLSAVSDRIESYCKREFKLKTYTEKFNPTPEQKVFRVRAYPISSITSIETDPTGTFSDIANITTIDTNSYRISADGRDIEFYVGTLTTSTITTLFPTPVRIIYTGGLSAHATISIFALEDVVGTLTIGSTCRGEDSGAYGIVSAVDGDSISVEISTGTFEDGESLIIGGATATLDEHTRTSLSESHRDLVRAAEIQTWYMRKNSTTLENSTFENDTVVRNIPSASFTIDYTFLPDVRSLLEPYRNKKFDYQFRK